MPLTPLIKGRKRREIKERMAKKKFRCQARISHMSSTVMDVGCERHDKKMDNCVGFPPQKGQRGLVINPILTRHERRELQ